MENTIEETYKKEILFDQETWDILNKVNPLHRHSLIGLSIRMLSKTPYYKELAGIKESEKPDGVVDLINSDEVKVAKEGVVEDTSKPVEKKKKKSMW